MEFHYDGHFYILLGIRYVVDPALFEALKTVRKHIKYAGHRLKSAKILEIDFATHLGYFLNRFVVNAAALYEFRIPP